MHFSFPSELEDDLLGEDLLSGKKVKRKKFAYKNYLVIPKTETHHHHLYSDEKHACHYLGQAYSQGRWLSE